MFVDTGGISADKTLLMQASCSGKIAGEDCIHSYRAKKNGTVSGIPCNFHKNIGFKKIIYLTELLTDCHQIYVRVVTLLPYKSMRSPF